METASFVDNRNRRAINIEQAIAIAYIFLLPIRMIYPLVFLQNYVHAAANYFDVLLHIVGIFLMIFCQRTFTIGKTDQCSRLIRYFGWMVVFFNISSLIMATYIQLTYGSYAGQSAFSGIVGMIVYFTQYFFILVYNRRVFQILNPERIYSVLGALCTFLLVLGYIQIAALNVSGIKNFLLRIDVLKILFPDEEMYKLSLTGTEGASAGAVLGTMVLPFLLADYLRGKRIRNLIKIILWLPVLFYMQSTTAYFSVIAALLVFFVLYIKYYRSKVVVLGIFLLLAIVGIFEFGQPLLQKLSEKSNVFYLFFEKIFDSSNQSTMQRLIPFETNWKIFLHFPIFGVGNGLQGYFYIKYYPAWASKVGNPFYVTAQNEIVNGGLFLPSILSGYGLVGLLIFIGYFVKVERRIRKYREKDNFFVNLYTIALLPLFICAMQGEFAGNYLIWFMLSLPYLILSREKDGNKNNAETTD